MINLFNTLIFIISICNSMNFHCMQIIQIQLQIYTNISLPNYMSIHNISVYIV